MSSPLTPTDPLSQVVFVHDYVQLVFQDERLSIYNRIKIRGAGIELESGAAGASDALIQLIGQRATGTPPPSPFVLALSFEQGVDVLVYAAEADSGPEAFEFIGRHGAFVVEQNS